jgi:GntR family transcriptional regulator / MocR family aminotransferase
VDLAVTLDDASAVPLHRQLYQELRRSILSGRLSPGHRVPSTRALARSLGVSRTTVTQCYEDLISEGYLQAAPGSGTFVCHHLPEELLKAVPIVLSSKLARPTTPTLSLSAYGNRVLDCTQSQTAAKEARISFKHWRPAFDQLPLRQWRRLVSRNSRTRRRAIFDYSDDSFGCERLREAIAGYVARSRAVRCEPDQVFICSGAQRAVDIVTRVLIDPGEGVAMEDPGYLGARQIFVAQGAKLLPVPVDESGIVVEELKARTTSKIKLVYVSPSHQFPTGVLLSLSRRLELLDWATRQDAFVIEDDYDSEYRYGGRPVPALQGLDQNDRVIYIGTFSKVLFPALRLGYLIAPQPLVEILARAKWLVDRQSPMIEQYALTDFINEGHLERHIRRMRTLYESRRKTFVDALSAHLGRRVSILGDNAGMHLMARFTTGFDDTELIARAAQRELEIVSARPYYLDAKYKGEFIFGYSNLSERKIQEGIRKLSQALTVGRV